MVKIRNKTGTFAKWIKRVVLAFLVLFLIFQIHYILRITWFGFFEPSSTPYMRQEEIRMNEASLRKIQYQGRFLPNLSLFNKSSGCSRGCQIHGALGRTVGSR